MQDRLDLGKNKTVACDFDLEANREEYETVTMAPFVIQQLLVRRRPDRVVFEVGPSAGWVYDIAKDCQADWDLEIQVANTNGDAWRWRNVKTKTDRRDALKLAKLSLLDQIDSVHIPAPVVRQRRSIVQYRSRLVAARTRIKNTIRSILHQSGLTMPGGARGWSGESLSDLHELARPLAEVDPVNLWRGELHEELSRLDEIEEHLSRVEKRLAALNKDNEQVALLESIPGVGPRTAEVISAVLDDPHRFRSAKEVSSYAGLVPKVLCSGQMNRHGRITKRGNRLLRHMLVEASWSALRYNPWFRHIYQRVKGSGRGRGRNAIVAVARRLLVTAWAMLRDGERWRCPEIPGGAPSSGAAICSAVACTT